MSLVELTPAAQEKVRELIPKEEAGKGLRLAVKGGGCSGLSYAQHFDQPKERDNQIAFDGFVVLIDPKSAIYLKGLTLDYDGSLNGRGFVYRNPNASNTCGCGESFSV